MDSDEAPAGQFASSGLLIAAEAVPAAVDRGRVNGAVADNDGND